jgi:hypothetical protein
VAACGSPGGTRVSSEQAAAICSMGLSGLLTHTATVSKWGNGLWACSM